MTTTPTYGNSCFPFAVNCRFSKTFIGVPKKCGYCQKMIVGTGFTCQHCSFKCHKRCIMIGKGNQVCLRPKPCSLSRLPPGDDTLISKLLKENEINSNDVDALFPPRNDKRHSDNSSKNDNTTDSDGSTPRKLDNHRHRRTSSKLRRRSRPLITRASFSIPNNSIFNDDPCCSSSLNSASTATSPSLISQPTSPDPRGTHQNHNRLRRVVRRNSTILSNANFSNSTTTSRRASAALIAVGQIHVEEKKTSSLLDRFFRLFPYWTPTPTASKSCNEERKKQNGSANSLSPRQENCRGRRVSSTKPLLHTKSTPSCHQTLVKYKTASQQASPATAREFNSAVLEKLFAESNHRKSIIETEIFNLKFPPKSIDHSKIDNKCQNKNLSIPQTKLVSISPLLHKFRLRTADAPATNGTGHKYLRNHESDPIKIVERKSARRDQNGGCTYVGGRRRRFKDGDDEEVEGKERLANTWPLSGYHIDYDEYDRLHSDESGQGLANANELGTNEGSRTDESTCEELRVRHTRLSDLGEWTIPHTDLELGECIHECRNMTTYKGRWHGDVMIHAYKMCFTETDHFMRTFLEEVQTLTKIRHENVALFMGASVEAPLLAVVTSIRKGCNLYETVHLENRRLAQTAKLNIARQVAQGMGYLHAKGIILKTLTSKSIYLECKVKISMVDDGAPLKRHDRSNLGCIRRGHLTYLSPELMQKMRVLPPALTVDGGFTKESDVYAFGTTLYEMFAHEFPFVQLATDAIVWSIGTGRRQKLDHLQCGAAMKGLIDDCWSFDPVYRPSFTEILKELHHTAGLHRKHSSSVPEKLNRAGMHRSPYNY